MLTLVGLPTASPTSSASALSASSLGVTPIRTGSLSSSLAQKHGSTRKGDRQSRFSPSSTLDSSQRLIGERMKSSEGEVKADSMASVGRRLSLLAGETMNANKSCIDDMSAHSVTKPWLLVSFDLHHFNRCMIAPSELLLRLTKSMNLHDNVIRFVLTMIIVSKDKQMNLKCLSQHQPLNMYTLKLQGRSHLRILGIVCFHDRW